MAVVQPSVSTEWASDPAALVLQPTTWQKSRGWTTSDSTNVGVADKPTLQHVNGWRKSVHDWLQYFKEELQGANANEFAIGSIQISMLTEVQFNSTLPVGFWVLMDGRDVTGSIYQTRTGNTTVPDMTDGQFLRSLGGQADPLGSKQAQNTNPNNFSATAAGQTHSGNATTVGNDTHNHSRTLYGRGTLSGGSAIFESTATENSGFPTTMYTNSGDANHRHLTSITHTHSSSTANFTTSDIETRPVNITMNHFMKIN